MTTTETQNAALDRYPASRPGRISYLFLSAVFVIAIATANWDALKGLFGVQ